VRQPSCRHFPRVTKKSVDIYPFTGIEISIPNIPYRVFFAHGCLLPEQDFGIGIRPAGMLKKNLTVRKVIPNVLLPVLLFVYRQAKRNQELL